MSKIEYKLEILKLTYSHGRDEKEAIRRARALEEYLFEESPVESKSSGSEAQKGDKNSEPNSTDKRPKKKSANLESLL